MEIQHPPHNLTTDTWLLAHHIPSIHYHHLVAWHQQKREVATMLQRHGLSTSIQKSIEADQKWASLAHHHIITIDDSRYPQLLKHIPSPPMLLYVKGNPQYLNAPQLCMVGSRKASIEGLNHAYNIAHQLAHQGFCITSGMALGIDKQAHMGALQIGPTIAVLACGLHRIYPKQHQHLSDRIVENGCLLSTYPCNTPIRRHQFPERNHIMSGLSLGTLIIEANVKSGTMISAYAAVNQGREVMVMPSDASGNQKLQEEGAHTIHHIDQIAKILTKPKQYQLLQCQLALEKYLYGYLHHHPSTLTELVHAIPQTKTAIEHAVATLMHHRLIKLEQAYYRTV